MYIVVFVLLTVVNTIFLECNLHVLVKAVKCIADQCVLADADTSLDCIDFHLHEICTYNVYLHTVIVLTGSLILHVSLFQTL